MSAAEESEEGVVAERRAPVGFDGPLGVLLRQCKRSFYFAAGLTVIIEILSVSPIIYVLNLYDRVLTSRSEVTLVSLLSLIAGVYILWTALDWVRTRLMIRISLRIDWELAAAVFDASFRRFLGQRKINAHQVMGDLLRLRQFLTGEPILALMSFPFAIIFAIIAAAFHIYLAIFIVVAMVVMTAATLINREMSSPILKAANETNQEGNRLAALSLRNSEAAFALGMQGNIRRQWHDRHQQFLELQVSASEASGVFGGFTSFLGRLLPSLQMTLGIWLAIHGHITGGMVLAATFLLTRSIAPMRMILMRWSDIAAAREAYHNLNALLAEDEKYAERMTLPAPAGQLRVRELVIQPPKARAPVLHDISLSLDRGEVLAVIGPSASGKTTLLKALTGLWKPLSGSVRLDGAEVSEWLRGDLGRYLGYVPQEIEFFEGTVAENIARLGDVDPEEVVRATRRVGLHPMILSFPKGYETKLGENGHPLTGGQKQRLALARALYGRPGYVLLDEPDASLDDNGQKALARTIREAAASGTTFIFSTHRAELLEIASKVLVLNEGRVQWFGNIAEFRAAAASVAETRAASVREGE